MDSILNQIRFLLQHTKTSEIRINDYLDAARRGCIDKFIFYGVLSKIRKCSLTFHISNDESSHFKIYDKHIVSEPNMEDVKGDVEIFKRFCENHKLNIKWCFRLTEFGLSGWKPVKHPNPPNEIKAPDGLVIECQDRHLPEMSTSCTS